MKTSKFAILAAFSFFGLTGQALADCPAGSSPFPGGILGSGPDTGFVQAVPGTAINGDPFIDPIPNNEDCFTPVDLNENEVGVASTGTINPIGNEGQGQIKLKPATVLGPNGTALGRGSFVGKLAPASCDIGTPSAQIGGTCKDEDDADIEGAVYTPQQFTPVSNGTALGANSEVSHDNSTAVGAGAKSTADYQVVLGTEEETITAPGITSQKSKDRQEGPLEVVTTDTNGNLASDGGQIFGTLEDHGDRIGSLEGGVSANSAAISANTALLSQHTKQLDEQAKATAIALAMPDAYLDASEKFAIAGGLGGWGDETALGFIATGRIDNTWSLYAGAGADTEFDQFGWKAGARAGW